MKKIIAFVAFTCICPALGFLARLPSSPSQLMPSSSAPSRRMLVPLDSSTLLTSLLQTVDKQQANAEFFFFFFGGSGALGIGGAQVPKLLALNKELQARKGGVSEGGADLNANPIATFGYPETLKEKDIMKIIKEMPSVDKISSLGVKKSYMSQLGYLEREGFDKSLPKCNPVAMYAVFDALSEGGGDLAAPGKATELITSWKDPENGLQKFKTDLLVANAKKWSAFGVFFFLIVLVLDLIVESGTNAFL